MSKFITFCNLDNSYSDHNEMKSHCIFHLYSHDSMTVSDTEDFFIYSLVICISSFENYLYKLFIF